MNQSVGGVLQLLLKAQSVQIQKTLVNSKLLSPAREVQRSRTRGRDIDIAIGAVHRERRPHLSDREKRYSHTSPARRGLLRNNPQQKIEADQRE